MRHVAGWWIPDTLVEGDSLNRHPWHSQRVDTGQIPFALACIKGRACAVQAGARIGQWPMILAKYFQHVVGIEPELANFQCAEANCSLEHNIVLHNAALGATCGMAPLLHSSESSGEHYVAPNFFVTETNPTEVVQITIDSLGLPAVDAIFLDVEGYELEALKGARATLLEFKPTIIFEENILCHRYGRKPGDVETWAKEFGYSRVAEWTTLPDRLQRDGKFRGSDIILAA